MTADASLETEMSVVPLQLMGIRLRGVVRMSYPNQSGKASNDRLHCARTSRYGIDSVYLPERVARKFGSCYK